MSQEKETLTVTMTGRPPVRVVKEDWPVIASARDWSGGHEFQAVDQWRITVRQHADGRTLLYGVHTSAYANVPTIRRGELLDPDQRENIPSVIAQVAEAIGAPETLADECIADLPAEDLN